MRRVSVRRRLSRCLSQFLIKLINFFDMRKVFISVLNRVLLARPLPKAMTTESSTGGRKLVVGLGNPGMDGTRHSVGMVVLGALAAQLGAADHWRGDRDVSGEVIVSRLRDTRVVLLRPRLLMNVNGVSVARAAAKYGVGPEDVLLVHDDMDKALGKVSVKHGGSARGHNGVRSCVECLQSDVMLRLRIGIGRPAGGTPVERHVLSRFTPEERTLLEPVLLRSVEVLLSLLCPQDSQSRCPPAGGRKDAKQQPPQTQPQISTPAPAKDSDSPAAAQT